MNLTENVGYNAFFRSLFRYIGIPLPRMADPDGDKHNWTTHVVETLISKKLDVCCETLNYVHLRKFSCQCKRRLIKKNPSLYKKRFSRENVLNHESTVSSQLFHNIEIPCDRADIYCNLLKFSVFLTCNQRFVFLRKNHYGPSSFCTCSCKGRKTSIDECYGKQFRAFNMP